MDGYVLCLSCQDPPLTYRRQGPTNYPVCVGHEIVGTVVRVGSKAEGGLKPGDRVGVGAQNDSCMGRRGDCEACSSGIENYCPVKRVDTYNDTHLNGDKSYGGYALYHRAPSHFVFRIPDAIPSSEAAPMLCGGITTYTPLKFHGAGPGKSVGIIGLGGLGHFGVMWAKALGADKVVVVSRTSAKKDDALKLGATEFIATDEDPKWAKTHANKLDIIVCTVSSTSMPMMKYLELLKLDGKFVQVGVPDDGLPTVFPLPLILKRITITGSLIGSPDDIREMLQLAADRKVKPWVEERPMSEANQALVDMENNKARYRYTLVNEDSKPVRAGL